MGHWDERFMNMARVVSSWSKDPGTKVGAYIAKGNVPISHGFNGFPRGTSDDPGLYENRERKYRRVLHAEQNAILFAKQELDGCTIYITHAPCSRCAAQIIQSGITRIVCPNPWNDSDYISRWREDVAETEAMCAEACIRLEYVNRG